MSYNPHNRIRLLLSSEKYSSLNPELIKNLIKNEKKGKPLEAFVIELLMLSGYRDRTSFFLYNLNNIIVHICLEKNTLDREVVQQLCKTSKFVSPLALLITRDNFLLILDIVLNGDNTGNNFNFLKTVKKSDICNYEWYCRYVALIYLGFVLYPETKTVDTIKKYKTLVLKYEIIKEYNHTDVQYTNTVADENVIIEKVKIFKRDANVDNIDKLFKETISLINSKYCVLTFIFSDNIITPEHVTHVFNSTNYKTTEYILNNGIVPTTENFDTLINNPLIKSLLKNHIYLNSNTNSYNYHLSAELNIAINNIAKIVKLYLNYKILPTDTFIDILETIIKNYNIIISNKIGKIVPDVHSTYSIICDIVNDLTNYNYPVSNKIYSFLIYKKNSIFKSDTISEDLYYYLYKFYDLAMVNIPINNFYNPLHIMRHMCLNKKTTLTAFKQYLEKNKVKPDRYCFEYATMYNKNIVEWMFSNNCLPTIKSTNIHNMRKVNRFIDNSYLVKVVDTIQTQEYMCEQYNDIVVEQ